MVELTPEQRKAAAECAEAAVAALEPDGSVHPGTVIAGAARMAGTILFRSFNFPLQNVPAGQPVLSMEANERGPQLVDVAGGMLAQLGIRIDLARITTSAPADQPRIGFLETQRILEPMFAKITNRYGLSVQQSAESAAAAAALLIHQYERSIDPSSAFGIAVYGFIEGTKTTPDPVALAK